MARDTMTREENLAYLKSEVRRYIAVARRQFEYSQTGDPYSGDRRGWAGQSFRWLNRAGVLRRRIFEIS